MDYVVGSVAALIASGNVTPNGPKVVKRALTPIKHKVSPNVTPKSELVNDRSIFLSPSVQKKKAILKKSPKRIFQNQNLDENKDVEVKSPKANKVKKHLENAMDTEGNDSTGQGNGKSLDFDQKKTVEAKSPKKKKNTLDISETEMNEVQTSPKKNKEQLTTEKTTVDEKENVIDDTNKESTGTPKNKSVRKRKSSLTNQIATEEANTSQSPKKQKKNLTEEKSETTEASNDKSQLSKSQKRRIRRIVKKLKIKQEKEAKALAGDEQLPAKGNKKKLKQKQLKAIPESTTESEITTGNEDSSKKNKKNKKQPKVDSNVTENEGSVPDTETDSKELKKKKPHFKDTNSNIANNELETEPILDNTKISKNLKTDNSKVRFIKSDNLEVKKKTQSNAVINKTPTSEGSEDEMETEPKKKVPKVNPNAITTMDSDSEHESDDDIESDTEQTNNEILIQNLEDSSDEEEQPKQETKKPNQKKPDEPRVIDEDEVKRTLFVGNVPFSKRTKKDIKKIFVKYGAIESVRMRTIPVADARMTPKLAVIKNELHPERSTVNVYVKFKEAASVDKALVENNTLLNENHLHVTKSETTGAHDTSMSVFVGNLPFAIEEEALRSKFLSCGAISDVRIVRDRNTNVGKGFGYVNFKSKDAVELALQMTEEDLTIKNRIIRVKRCTTNPPKQHQNQVKSKFNQRPNQNWTQRPNGPQKFGRQGNDQSDGAYRRIMNKRPHQGGDGGPPNKKEKKPRKEFVGLTSEKKKKQKFNKGQKKKKVLSEILTK